MGGGFPCRPGGSGGVEKNSSSQVVFACVCVILCMSREIGTDFSGFLCAKVVFFVRVLFPTPFEQCLGFFFFRKAGRQFVRLEGEGGNISRPRDGLVSRRLVRKRENGKGKDRLRFSREFR